jgi:hypothetical protein
MKRALMTCLCAGALLSMMSCATGPEGKGDKSYTQSKKVAEGDERRMLEKTAYMNYKTAISAHPDKISPRLRSRFLELALKRGRMILTEGGYWFEAVPLILDEIEKRWSADVPDSLKDMYGELLVQLADSGFENTHVSVGLENLDKAVEKSADKARFAKARTDRIGNLAEQYQAMATAELTQGKENKDAESMVRAEFYAQMALEFDSASMEAASLLSKARVENVSTYSLYKKVIDPPPDTVLYKKINKYDIFMAVAAQLNKGRTTTMQVTMWNYSYNPQRLKPQSFKLQDTNGKQYTALGSSTIKPEILDQEFETKLTLQFPSPGARIYKLIYDNPPHYSEKLFY